MNDSDVYRFTRHDVESRKPFHLGGLVQANVGQKLLNSNILRVLSYRSYKHATFHLTQCMMQIKYYNIYLTA